MSELRSALEALVAEDPLLVGDEELLASIEELFDTRARLDAVICRRLAAATTRESTIAVCGRTPRSWLIQELRRSAVEAGRRVAVARGLAMHPVLAAAFDAGEISFEHARVINSCFRYLPITWHATAEEVLVEASRTLSPDELGPILDKLRETLGNQTAEEREQRRYDSRWCTVSTTFAGMVHLEAMVDPESGQTLLTAINALMAQHGDSDLRTVVQVRADALVDLARQSLAHGGLPDIGGDRPHIAVTMPWQWLYDALDDLNATGPAGTLDGLPITPATARRLACDAQLIPAVLGSDRAVLDVGRATPTWNVHQRRAAALRDSGCVWPDCHASLDRCQLHHLDHYARGGPTNLDNSAYLCHFHHWLVHHRNWTITRDSDTKKIAVRRT